jgi:signal-transduction protein with cAMP-binding, CBS, and nucleotidyltransferase domain
MGDDRRRERVQESVMLDVPVRRYVTKKLIGVEKDTSIQNSVARMVDFDISSLTVTEGENVVGFLTDSDIKRRVVAGGVSPSELIESVMTRDLITADINSTVKDVLAVMSEHSIKHVLITEESGIVGILTLRDIEDVGRQKLETYIARE